MGMYLDLDDVVYGNPKAEAELDSILNLLAIAYDNLNDMPISEEWAKEWCKLASEYMRLDT